MSASRSIPTMFDPYYAASRRSHDVLARLERAAVTKEPIISRQNSLRQSGETGNAGMVRLALALPLRGFVRTSLTMTDGNCIFGQTELLPMALAAFTRFYSGVK